MRVFWPGGLTGLRSYLHLFRVSRDTDNGMSGIYCGERGGNEGDGKKVSALSMFQPYRAQRAEERAWPGLAWPRRETRGRLFYARNINNRRLFLETRRVSRTRSPCRYHFGFLCLVWRLDIGTHCVEDYQCFIGAGSPVSRVPRGNTKKRGPPLELHNCPKSRYISTNYKGYHNRKLPGKTYRDRLIIG